LPFVLAALVAGHLLYLHVSGSSNPIGTTSNTDRTPFHPYFSFKDIVTVFLFFILFALIIFFAPDTLGHSDNYIEANSMQTPVSIVPEWYLLPFYAILRSIPNKLLGVISMFVAILILLILPFVDAGKIKGNTYKPLHILIFWLFALNFLILMWLGSCHVEA
jgi:ubiquinol-cytochrome c reductase cytochrome b subunit